MWSGPTLNHKTKVVPFVLSHNFLQNLPSALPPSRYSKFFEDALQFMGTSSGQVSKQETIASSSTSTFLMKQCYFGGFNLHRSSQSSGLSKCLAFIMRSYFAKLLQFCKIAPTLVQKKETPTQCKAFQKRIATEFKDNEKQLFSETTPVATKESTKDRPNFSRHPYRFVTLSQTFRAAAASLVGVVWLSTAGELATPPGTYLSMTLPLHGKDSTQSLYFSHSWHTPKECFVREARCNLVTLSAKNRATNSFLDLAPLVCRDITSISHVHCLLSSLSS